jgi:hypothetical protein
MLGYPDHNRLLQAARTQEILCLLQSHFFARLAQFRDYVAVGKARSIQNLTLTNGSMSHWSKGNQLLVLSLGQ